MINILSGGYCNGLLGNDNGIPILVGDLIHYLYIGIKIVIPILLIFFGILDLGKAITAKKEEDIKKYQSSFIKRIITGILVFLVAIIVEFLLGFVEPEQGGSSDSPVKCALEIINGKSRNVNNVTRH